MTTTQVLEKSFHPINIEEKWASYWNKQGYFIPNGHTQVPSFCIQLPPPNVTGTLHMGHAFNQTIIDGLIRYHRMRGENTLWIPGCDHAGIATQIVVERQLNQHHISRHDLGRDVFVEKVWEWKEQSGTTITNQMRRLGVSPDWEHEYFTMDKDRSVAVTEVFVRLYEAGLIYRGKRLVNWDPVLGTAVSDLEVISEEEAGSMWHIRYPLVDKSGEVVVATTRPETLLGDVAVAVDPTDERYAHLIGKMLQLPLTDRVIPIIADSYVDKDFGTGCVKITPAHDFNDYAVGERHQLPCINIFTLTAELNDQVPVPYQGLDRFVARKQIVADLEEQGYLVEVKPHQLMVPRGDRTGVVIEPMLTDQWFMAMKKPAGQHAYFPGKSLSEVALEKVANGEIRFVPDNWTTTYNQWLEDIQDWCISRQLWWGHQIPAWYAEDGRIFVASTLEAAEKQALAAGYDGPLKRDDDVLDTWFSSALVPFSTLGWPNDTPDLSHFLPSSVLVTGFDIIFFWVARMIMMTTYFTGKIPFSTVYVHGLVRDATGQKMSKSKGNTLDPIDLIDGISQEALIVKRTTGLMHPKDADKIARATRQEFPQGIAAHGTDALRFTMASYASLGRNINFDISRCEGYQHFCNKLWNATRFVLMHTEKYTTALDKKNCHFSLVDRWILSTLEQTIMLVTEGFRDFRFDYIASAIYQFVWDQYCDWYLEFAKVALQEEGSEQHYATSWTLLYVLETMLRVAHPIIPFITEELWQVVAPKLKEVHYEQGSSITVAPYPMVDSVQQDEEAECFIAGIKELIGACRNLRSDMHLSPAVRVPLLLEVGNTDHLEKMMATTPYIKALAKLSDVKWVDTLPQSIAPILIVGNKKLMLQVEVDVVAEKSRLAKEISRIKADRDKIQAKLDNPHFRQRAPQAVVEQETQKIKQYLDTLDQLSTQLEKINQIESLVSHEK